MGTGASARPTFSEEWMSESSQELDELGGGLRPPVKRGQSTKFRLEWLKDALSAQGNRLEEALAKDPLAGRHEILRQEAIKLVKENPSAIHQFSVREWMTRKHTDLRTLQAREDLEKKMRERMGAPEPGGGKDRNRVSDQGNRRESEAGNKRVSEAGNKPEWNSLHWTNTAIPELQRKKLANTSSDGKQGSDDGEPMPPRRPQVPLAEWRHRVARAKRKAMLIISVVLAFRGRKHRARGLQRLDSLSYFIAQHLAGELPRFVDEQAAYRSGKANVDSLQALAEELWREQNYNGGGNGEGDGADGDGSVPFGDGDGGLAGASPVNSITSQGMDVSQLPWAPQGVRSGSSMTGVAPGLAAGGGVSGSAVGTYGTVSGRSTPPPPLRLPGSWTGGPPAQAGGGASGGGPSSLLRSRPINLTPTLHHISQAGGSTSATPSTALSPSSQAPVLQSQANPTTSANGGAPSSPGSGGGGGRNGISGAMPATALGGGGSGGGTAGPAASLPALQRPGSAAGNGLRMSMPSGGLPTSSPQLGMELESSLSSGIGGARTSRFSVPGGVSASVDFSAVSAAGGGGLVLTSVTEDGMNSAEAAALAAAAAAAVGGSGAAAANGSKGGKWSVPRFLGGKGKDAAAGPSNGKRGAKGSLLAAGGDELSMVARAQSWAGPAPSTMTVGPPPVPHSRSLGPGGPISPAGSGVLAPAPPSAPAPPAGAARNPRNRRSSAILSSSGGPPSANGGGSASGEAPWSPGLTGFGAPPLRSVTTPASPGGPRPRGGSTGSGAFGSTSGGGFGTSRSAFGGGPPRRAAGAGTRRGSTSGEASNRTSVSGAGTDLRGSSTGERVSLSGARRAAVDGGGEQVYLKFQEESAALEKPLRMMQMYANRANARWVEEMAGAVVAVVGTPGAAAGAATPQKDAPSPASTSSLSSQAAAAAVAAGSGFEPPFVYDASRFSASVGGAQSSAFKSEVASMLRSGRMAVQVLAGDDNVILASGTAQALWSADPWDLIAAAFPAKAGAPDRVRAVHMGPRLLMALVMALEAVAGPEAVAKLVVVLHVNESQRAEVVRDLRFRRFCGLRPENLILLVQHRRCGYAWRPEQHVFVRDESGQLASAGSGYAIMQLVWPGEAFQLTAEDPVAVLAEAGPSGGGAAVTAARSAVAAARRAGRDAASAGVVPLETSVLDALAARGVQWLLTRRLRDINLYHPELTLDAEVLAYSLFLHDSMGANMSVQVEYVDGVQAVRQAQSGVVMAPPRLARSTTEKAEGSGGGGGTDGGSSPTPAGQNAPRRAGAFARERGSASQPEGKRASHHPNYVVDVKVSDTMTPRVTHLLNEVRTRGKGRLVVSTRRYMWKVDVLKALVQRPSVFRPSLEVAADLAYLTFDMSDLTAAAEWGARCVAVASRHPARSLLSAADLEDLLGVITAQDASGVFRRLAGNTSIPRAQTAPAGSEAQRRPSLTAQMHSLSVGPGSAFAVTNGGGPSSPMQGGGNSAGLGTPHSSLAPGSSNGPLLGQRIVVLVADNDSTSLAVKLLMSMVKPGRDAVVLVTVVTSILQEGSGRSLLRKHELALAQTMVEVSSELLTKNPSGPLLDQLELFCDAVDANLVVMGSQVLAAATGSGGGGGGSGASFAGGWGGGSGASFSGGGSGFGSGMSFSGGGGGGGTAIMASMALSLLKNAMRPMLIVKANAKLAQIAWDADKLRVLVEVHHTSRHLLRYVATKLMSATRQDKLFLGRGGAKDSGAQDNVTSRRMLQNFEDIAAQHNFSAVKRPMEEPFEVGAVRHADLEKMHLIAMQAPAGRGLPDSILHVLKAARSAVLVYKSNEAF